MKERRLVGLFPEVNPSRTVRGSCFAEQPKHAWPCVLIPPGVSHPHLEYATNMLYILGPGLRAGEPLMSTPSKEMNI